MDLSGADKRRQIGCRYWGESSNVCFAGNDTNGGTGDDDRLRHMRLPKGNELVPVRERPRRGRDPGPCQRSDPQPAVRQVLDQVQRQVIDVDQQSRPQHVLAHQVYLGAAAGQERAVRALPDQRDRGTGVGSPYVAERPHHRSPPAASRTPRITARMFGYAAHRQILPLIHSAISASSPAWPSSSSFTADMIWPGVQYPHWNASCSTNASCTGCSPPSAARPSIVVTSRPSQVTASVRHASTRLPSTRTVHAPQQPRRGRNAKRASQLRWCQLPRQLQQGQRVAARLGDEPLLHPLIQRPRDHRGQQLPGVTVTQPPDSQFRQTAELPARLTRRDHEGNLLGKQPARQPPTRSRPPAARSCPPRPRRAPPARRCARRARPPAAGRAPLARRDDLAASPAPRAITDAVAPYRELPR